MTLETAIGTLPAPLNKEKYCKLRRGIWNDEDVCVMINEKRDFTFLYPRPSMDYSEYVPRSQALGLKAYRATNQVIEQRFEKVRELLATASSVVEIGGADGAFLDAAHTENPDLVCACIEPDENTKEMRDRLGWLKQYSDFDAAMAENFRYDAVVLFHVFEHIEEPGSFLENCRKLLDDGGRLILEVPALSDPLLSLFEHSGYEQFYFQKQHPYVYTADSLGRVLAHSGFRVNRTIMHQRYGLENHLGWLCHGKPGGDEKFRKLFATLDSDYRRVIEESGNADSVIIEAVTTTRYIN